MSKTLSPATSLIISIFGGVALGLAWILPNTLYSALLGLSALFALIFPLVQNSSCYLQYFLYGVTANLIAFYWLIPTISNFGGYPLSISIGLYLLFAVYHAGLYLLFLLIFRRINSRFANWTILKAFFAWGAIKYIYPEIFPWDFAHTIISLRPLIQVADLGGSMFVTAVMFAIIALLNQLLKFDLKKPIFLINLACLTLIIGYGLKRINYFDQLIAPEKKISIIQSEVSIQKSQGVSFLAADPNRYLQLSEEILLSFQPDLIIWPETVIVQPVSTSIRSISETANLPYLPDTNLITGALSYENNATHNSAFAILNSGEILPPYHKQILMPFGEFMPFAETFPFLAELNPNFAPITPGTKISIFNLDNGLKIAPLICYEDLTPKISRQATLNGGNLLVNLTNDAWFGYSVAPLQHNLIASFRAIENRRYLARSTNSGLTSVIDPTGLTLNQIPLFTEGLINTKIKLIEERTLYTNFYGSYFWLMIVIISLLIIVFPKRKK